MTQTFARFEKMLRPLVPGAPIEVIQQEFQETARAFYRRTRAWWETIPGVSVVGGITDIPLNPVDQNADVVFVESVVAVSGGYARFYLLDPHTMRVEAKGNAVVDIIVSVQPREGVDVLPDEAVTHHREGLRAGTLARLYAHPLKPYTNPAEAQRLERRFESEIARGISLRRTGAGQHSVQAKVRIPTVPLR